MTEQLLVDFLLHLALCPEGHINGNAYNFYLRKICHNNFVCIFKNHCRENLGSSKKMGKAESGVKVGTMSYRCDIMTVWTVKMSTDRMGNPSNILHGEIRGIHVKLSTGTRTLENERLLGIQ